MQIVSKKPPNFKFGEVYNISTIDDEPSGELKYVTLIKSEINKNYAYTFRYVCTD